MYGAPYQYAQGSNPNAPSQPPHQHPSLSQQQSYMPNLASQQHQSQSSHISQQQQFQQDRQRQIMFNQGQQGNQTYNGGQMSGGQQGYNATGMAGMPANMVNPNVGMMQTGAGGMPHMPAGASGLAASSSYQTPYTASPYNASSKAASNPSSNSTPGQVQIGFPPNTSGQYTNLQAQALAQAQAQRQNIPNQMNAAQAQRASPFGAQGQMGTPPSFNTPQNSGHATHNSMSMPTPGMTTMHGPGGSQGPGGQTPQRQAQSGSQTPVTPASGLPSGSVTAGTTQAQAAPQAQSQAPSTLSPEAEAREKGRVGLLLEINKVLLMEVLQIQTKTAELKAKSDEADKNRADGERTKPDPQMSKEFVECMRRIQFNLSYLAAVADSSHKQTAKPLHPAIISAPILVSMKKAKAEREAKKEGGKDGGDKDEKEEEEGEGEDRAETLRGMYEQLQKLFPGVDPKKEPPLPQPGKPPGQQGRQSQQPQQPNQIQPQQSQPPAILPPSTPQAQNQMRNMNAPNIGINPASLSSPYPSNQTINLQMTPQQSNANMSQNSMNAMASTMQSQNQNINPNSISQGQGQNSMMGGQQGQMGIGQQQGTGVAGTPQQMASNEQRARMIAQLQSMGPQQRMEVMQKMGMNQQQAAALMGRGGQIGLGAGGTGGAGHGNMQGGMRQMGGQMGMNGMYRQ